MPRTFRSGFAVLVFVLFGLPGLSPVRAQEVVWQQAGDGQSAWGPSQRSQTSTYGVVDSELADDFDLVGTITQVYAAGYNGAQTNSPPPLSGVYVRFYAFNADGTPGGLQREYFLAAGDASLQVTGFVPSSFRATLSPAFEASGRHFVSVQPVLDPAWGQYWYWWSDNTNAPRGQALYFRDRAAGQTAWGRAIGPSTANSDLAFTLYGTRAVVPAPVVSTLSAASLAHAGRLKISGANFGATQGPSVVRIGGVAAPVSRWSDTSVTAYVPDSVPVGAADVQVVTAAGASNAVSLDVTARQREGQVRWRFQADDAYVAGRPGVGPDGTVYVPGINGHLYALTPAGGVKWIFRVNGVIQQSVAVASDGTVYFAAGPTLWALNPDGTAKWNVTDPARMEIDAGPSLGPDGNVYAVSNDSNLGGFGAFAVSPAGQILWTRPGFRHEYGTAARVREIVFGSPSQFYFSANNLNGITGLQAFTLAGAFRWSQPASGQQPAVAPDGRVYVVNTTELHAFDPQGNLLRRLFGAGTFELSTPDVGSDGTVYVSQNSSNLVAVSPDGRELWRFAGGGIFGGPIVNAANSLVVVGGYPTGQPGFVHGVSASGGRLQWTVNLPFENEGYVRPMARPRFSADGSTVYVGTSLDTYAAETYSYLYAIDTGLAAQPAPALSSLTLSPSSVTGGGTSQGTVTLSAPAPAGGAVVTLSSGNTAVATVPASVTVAGGATSATFTVTTRTVSTTTAVSISAAHGGVTKTATLTVTPAPAADTVSVTRAEYTASKKTLRVDATSTNASAVLRAYVTSTGALIGTLKNSGGGRHTGQFTWPSNPQNVTVRSSLGGSASRAVTLR